MKSYLKTTYCKIIEILDVSDKITKYLKINKLPYSLQFENPLWGCQTQN